MEAKFSRSLAEVVTEQGFEMGRPSLLGAKVERDATAAVADGRRVRHR